MAARTGDTKGAWSHSSRVSNCQPKTGWTKNTSFYSKINRKI